MEELNSKANYSRVRGILTQLEEFRSGPERKEWLEEDMPDLSHLKTVVGQKLVEELGAFERVAFKNNSYDEAYNLYSVYHFKDHGIYIRFEGSYTSHDGINCERIFQVEPTLVTETQYLAVK